MEELRSEIRSDIRISASHVYCLAILDVLEGRNCVSFFFIFPGLPIRLDTVLINVC